MSRTSTLALAAIAAAAIAQAAPNDRDCTWQPMPRATAIRPEIAAVFAPPPDVVVETGHGSRASMGPMEVMVVRKDPDGKLTFACVNDAAAAERFLGGTTDAAGKAKDK